MTELTIINSLREAMEREYASFLDSPKHSFSPKFEKKMNKLIRREKKRSWRFTNTLGKRLALVASCIVLICCCVFVGSAEAREEFGEDVRRIIEKLQNNSLTQRHAVKANDRITNSFAYDENGMWIYPDDFGGTYFDGEYLILCLKDADQTAINRYLSIAGSEAEYVQIRIVKYSQNELQSIADLQAALFNEQAVPIYSYWVDPVINGIIFVTDEENVQYVDDALDKQCPDIPHRAEIAEVSDSL